MSDTYSYEVLEPGGHARLVGNVLDRISRASANPASAVGSAAALLGDSETASWMERTTAADGAALVDAIYGNTIVQDDSLLPVRMEGVETVGFNQWDEEWELGGISNSNGEDITASNRIRSKNYIRVTPSTQYCFTLPWAYIYAYDSNKNFVAYGMSNGAAPLSFPSCIDDANTHPRTWTIPSGVNYIRVVITTYYGTTYNHDICINISDPARNGTYEPHWSSERAIPAATYFPNGMRSAGSVRDELRADAAVTRVGSRAYQSGDEDDASVITDGTTTFYALATPTTTPIDPTLPLSYRVGAGGTERVMVASGTQSAPPIFATRYPLDPTDLAASIAPRESAVAEANHAVGDLVMLGWTLCKVTTAIARGETITIGTNVTRTSVAAELAALS